MPTITEHYQLSAISALAEANGLTEVHNSGPCVDGRLVIFGDDRYAEDYLRGRCTAGVRTEIVIAPGTGAIRSAHQYQDGEPIGTVTPTGGNEGQRLMWTLQLLERVGPHGLVDDERLNFDAIEAAPYYDDAAFAEAWVRAVRLAGPRFFGQGVDEAPADGTRKWELAPIYDDVLGALGYLSSGEAAFLATLYGFYNADAAAKMLRKLRLGGLADVAAVLDEPRRRVVADLFVSYAGW